MISGNNTGGFRTSYYGSDSELNTETGASVDEGFLYGGVIGLPESASEGDLLADIGYEVSSDQLEVEDGGLYLYDSRAGSDSPYEVPRSAPAYLSGPMTGAAWAPLGNYITGTGSAEGFGFIPSTNAMTAHGLPTEEVFALYNRAQNLGRADGVSQTSTASPTSVLVTLAAAGRNPTDITLPTVGSQGGGGDEEDDAAAASSGTTDAAASQSSLSAPASSTATASAGSSGGGSSGDTAKAPAAGSSGASSAGSSGSNAAVEGGSGNAAGEGEVAPTDETGGGGEGSHLTFEQMTILAAQGYDPANIIKADEALAAGASDETIMLVLGRRAGPSGEGTTRSPVCKNDRRGRHGACRKGRACAPADHGQRWCNSERVGGRRGYFFRRFDSTGS